MPITSLCDVDPPWADDDIIVEVDEDDEYERGVDAQLDEGMDEHE